MEVACFGHAINGGIIINERTQSTVRGLYAAGEVACRPNGADRLRGNMVLTCQVFGRRAGYHAAKDVQTRTIEPIPKDIIDRAMARIEKVPKKDGAINPPF